MKQEGGAGSNEDDASANGSAGCRDSRSAKRGKVGGEQSGDEAEAGRIRDERRAAQLREAQRAYRQRKNEKTKGMEEKLTEKTRELRAANERISFLELQLASRQDTATAASSAQQHHLMNASAEAQIQMQLHLQRIQEDHQHTLRNLHERIAELESKNAQLSSENNHLTAAASALSAASQSRRPSPPLQLDSTAQPPPTPFQLRLASVDSTPFPNLEFSFPGASSILAASATSTAPPAGSPHALTQSPAPSTFSRHPSPVSLSRVIHPASHFSPSTSSASMQPQTQPSPMLIAGKEGVVSSPSALSDLDSAMLERAELARAELKMVPSLRDCKWVDLMIDMLKRPGKTKKDGARMLNHRHRLLATCNVMDTQCALEIMEKYIGFVAMVASGIGSDISPNSVRFDTDPFDSVCSSPKSEFSHPPVTVAAALPPPSTASSGGGSVMTDLPDIKYPETSPFFEAVKAITSLRQHVELVREFRVLFYAQDQEPDKARREELYYRFVEMGQRLAGLCSEEDRTKFLLAIEIGRASNKKAVDEMVAVTDS